jgi:hypothetical protein
MSQAYMSQDKIQDPRTPMADAELRTNVQALSALLDADFVRVGQLGLMLNKEQYNMRVARLGDATSWRRVEGAQHPPARSADPKRLEQKNAAVARASGDLKQEAFTWQEVQVRVYGDAAVAIGSQIQKTTYPARDASGQDRGTQELARKNDGWVIVSLHLSPGDPPVFRGQVRGPQHLVCCDLPNVQHTVGAVFGLWRSFAPQTSLDIEPESPATLHSRPTDPLV